MVSKGFIDNQDNIETSNNVGLTEKSSKEDSVSVSRVDINVLKSKLQETQNKEFKKNLFLTKPKLAWRLPLWSLKLHLRTMTKMQLPW